VPRSRRSRRRSGRWFRTNRSPSGARTSTTNVSSLPRRLSLLPSATVFWNIILFYVPRYLSTVPYHSTILVAGRDERDHSLPTPPGHVALGRSPAPAGARVWRGRNDDRCDDRCDDGVKRVRRDTTVHHVELRKRVIHEPDRRARCSRAELTHGVRPWPHVDGGDHWRSSEPAPCFGGGKGGRQGTRLLNADGDPAVVARPGESDKAAGRRAVGRGFGVQQGRAARHQRVDRWVLDSTDAR